MGNTGGADEEVNDLRQNASEGTVRDNTCARESVLITDDRLVM